MINLYYLEEEEGMIFLYKDRECKKLYAKIPTHYENAPKFDQTTIILNCYEFNLVELDRTNVLFRVVINRVLGDFARFNACNFLSLKKVAQLAHRGYSSEWIYDYAVDCNSGFKQNKFA